MIRGQPASQLCRSALSYNVYHYILHKLPLFFGRSIFNLNLLASTPPYPYWFPVDILAANTLYYAHPERPGYFKTL